MFFDHILRTYKVVVLGIFWATLCLLICLSGFSTSHIAADGTEITFFVKDHVFANIFTVFLFVLALVLRKYMKPVSKMLERLNQDEIFFLKYRRSLLMILFGISCIWVLSTQYAARSDQMNVQYAAYTLHFGDYAMFQEDGYLARCNNQLGLVWISYLLSFLFGNYNYVCFQLLNALALTVFYWKLSEVGAYFGMRRTGQLAVILLGILFFPLIMYCSFVYGSILGLMFSLVAIEKELSFFKNLKYRQAVWSAVAIAAAVMLKMNYLIFLIGMLVIAMVEIIRSKRIQILLLPVLAVLFCVLQSYGVVKVSEGFTGEPLDQGASSWAYIAMGLQDSAGSAGWWNGYNEYSYIESNYNTSVQAETAKKDIRESIKYFWSNKAEALRFFTEKTASQWNNPTFQCFWIVQLCSTDIEKSSWVWYFTSLIGAYQCTFYLNLLQFLILFGALVYGIAVWRRSFEPGTFVLAVIFIGGFAFHLIWEAKAQYTILYFVLLFPYTVMGYEELTNCIAGIYEHIRSGETVGRLMTKASPQVVVMTVLFVAALIGSGILCTTGVTAYLTGDTGRYFAYLSENDGRPVLSEGDYRFCTRSGQALGLSDISETGVGAMALLDGAQKDKTVIRTANYQQNTWLSIVPYQLYLTAEEVSDGEEGTVSALSSRNESGRVWMIRDAGEGGLFLTCAPNLALTYNEKEGTVYLTEFTGITEQIWYAIKEK